MQTRLHKALDAVLDARPLHPSRDDWTVQNIGPAFCPYHIQRQAAFFEAVQALGYERLDAWENAEKRCTIAFEPDYDLDRYDGAAWRLA